jgi:hypothetical protein
MPATSVGRSVGSVSVLMNEKYDWTTPPAIGISISIVYIACATVPTYWQAGTRRYYVNCLISRYVIFCASSLTRVYGVHRRTTTPLPSQLPTNGSFRDCYNITTLSLLLQYIIMIIYFAVINSKRYSVF